MDTKDLNYFCVKFLLKKGELFEKELSLYRPPAVKVFHFKNFSMILLFNLFLSKVNNSDGNNTKFEIIAINKATATYTQNTNETKGLLENCVKTQL